jgi:hypothetical protein
MLEAFQASSEEPVSSTQEGASSQPYQAPAPAVRSKASSGLPDVAPELFALVLGVLVVGSFFLGRWSVSTSVQASSGEVATQPERMNEEPLFVNASGELQKPSEPVSAPRVVEPTKPPLVPSDQAQASRNPLEVNHEAFMDSANTQTIRVIYYSDDDDGRTKAFQTATYLAELGFPAMIPVRKGGHVFVCVGAAPKKDDPELLRIQRELRLVVGPPPSSNPGDFESAYVYNIDRLITR